MSPPSKLPDPTTVRFKMAAPDVTLPPRLAGKAGLIESPTAIQKWGADYGLHATGTGPFELVEWIKDDHLNLKRFDGYWERDAQGAQLPYFDTMVFKPIPDPGVALTALRVGTVDLIQAILPSDLVQAPGRPAVDIGGRAGFHAGRLAAGPETPLQ